MIVTMTVPGATGDSCAYACVAPATPATATNTAIQFFITDLPRIFVSPLLSRAGVGRHNRAEVQARGQACSGAARVSRGGARCRPFGRWLVGGVGKTSRAGSVGRANFGCSGSVNGTVNRE